jgi:hypothetical protein
MHCDRQGRGVEKRVDRALLSQQGLDFERHLADPFEIPIAFRGHAWHITAVEVTVWRA